MIFVCVGMHHQGFDRLIRAVDLLAPSLAEPLVMQIGASRYEPRNGRYFRFADSEEVQTLVRNARVVVTHCGAGSVITALKHRVPVVVVPRLKRFAEHVDDHQLELAKVLSESGKVTAVYDVETLPQAIAQATEPPDGDGHRRELIDTVGQYLRELTGGQRQGAARP